MCVNNNINIKNIWHTANIWETYDLDQLTSSEILNSTYFPQLFNGSFKHILMLCDINELRRRLEYFFSRVSVMIIEYYGCDQKLRIENLPIENCMFKTVVDYYYRWSPLENCVLKIHVKKVHFADKELRIENCRSRIAYWKLLIENSRWRIPFWKFAIKKSVLKVPD